MSIVAEQRNKNTTKLGIPNTLNVKPENRTLIRSHNNKRTLDVLVDFRGFGQFIGHLMHGANGARSTTQCSPGTNTPNMEVNSPRTFPLFIYLLQKLLEDLVSINNKRQ